eukprot:gb/GECG01012683.1/.p1 GENE.gb/GECG01012683.1/~~gb/GECG01012683.1/.p1  ORF type:complete len:356 (+),score=73.31 gb/GECG01012683.1/:1-1068(+)
MSRRKNQHEGGSQAPATSTVANESIRSPYHAQPIPAQQWAQLTQQIPGWNQMTPMIVFPPSTGGSATVGTIDYSGPPPTNESNQYEMLPQMFPLPQMQFQGSPNAGNANYGNPGQDEFATSLRMLSSMSEGPSSFSMDNTNVFSPGMVSAAVPTTSGNQEKNLRSGSTKRKKQEDNSTSAANSSEGNNQYKNKRRRSNAPLPSVVETRLQDGVEDKKGKKMTSKYACVSWNRNARKWQAYLRIQGKRIHLGYYEDEDKAAEVVERAKQKRMQQTMEQGGAPPELQKTSKKGKSEKTSAATPATLADDISAAAQVSPATSSSAEPTLIDPVQVMATFNYSSTGFSHALHSDDLTNI